MVIIDITVEKRFIFPGNSHHIQDETLKFKSISVYNAYLRAYNSSVIHDTCLRKNASFKLTPTGEHILGQ